MEHVYCLKRLIFVLLKSLHNLMTMKHLIQYEFNWFIFMLLKTTYLLNVNALVSVLIAINSKSRHLQREHLCETYKIIFWTPSWNGTKRYKTCQIQQIFASIIPLIWRNVHHNVSYLYLCFLNKVITFWFFQIIWRLIYPKLIGINQVWGVLLERKFCPDNI